MLNMVINIFQHLISSMFLSDVYGLMKNILCLLFIAPHCNMTVTLVQHYIISNWPLYGVSYLKSELLVSTTLSPTF